MKCKYDCCKNEVIPSETGKQKLFCNNKCKIKFHVDKKRWQLKLESVKYKGGECEQCGYKKCPTALEFHHIDPTQKEFAISKQPHTRSWDRLKVELDKCSLLCSNCHKEEEFRLRSSQKSFMNEMLSEYGY